MRNRTTLAAAAIAVLGMLPAGCAGGPAGPARLDRPASSRYTAVTAATRACPSLLLTSADGGTDTKEESVMQFKRTALAALVIAAAAAPNAPAMVADAAGTRPAASQTAAPAHGSTRFTDERALRDALRNRELPQAESALVGSFVHSDADGFDWSSALIGASVPFALLLAGVLARPALTRRRTRTSALA